MLRRVGLEGIPRAEPLGREGPQMVGGIGIEPMTPPV